MPARIAMIEDDAADYGLGRAWRALTLYLASRYDVLYISVNPIHADLAGKVRYVHLDEKYSGDRTKNSLKRAVGSSGLLRKILKQEKADIAISFGLYACARLAIATFGLKTKVVMAERGNPLRHSKRGQKCVQLIYSFADRLVYQSEAGKRCASRGNQKKSVVIPNAVYRDNLPVPERVCVRKEIVASSRIHTEKRYDMLLRAFEVFVRTHEDYTLIIYGEEETGTTHGCLPQLKQLASDLGIDGKVIFAGHVDDVCQRMAGAKAFVFTSIGEGMPNSVIEAMAMGVPCITTDYEPGGANELIQNGIDGIIVPHDGEQELADAMCLLADDNALCEAIAIKALNIRNKLSKETVFAQWESMIQGLSSEV